LRSLSSSALHVPRVAAADLSVADFRRRFEAPHRPVIVEGIDYGMASRWNDRRTLLAFLGRDRLWDKEHARRVELTRFLSDEKGCIENGQSAGYIFEFLGHRHSAAGEAEPEAEAARAKIRSAYAVPPYFARDLFDVKLDAFELATMQPPEHRWLLIGRPGSGSAPHVDANATSAWNALLGGGMKRWVLLSPGAGADAALDTGFRGSAAEWFARELPRLRERLDRSPTEGSDSQLVEFHQRVGQTVYVPQGWCHAVLNVPSEDVVASDGGTFDADEACVCLTQNFASVYDVDEVRQKLRAYGGASFAARWRSRFRDVVAGEQP
jgi:hypothetical protein